MNYGYYAKRIMKNTIFKTLEDTREILFYENGIYKSGGHTLIETQCESMVPDCSTHDTREILNKIKRNTYVSRDSFDNYPNLLNLKNGILDIQTGKVCDHSPEYLFRIQFPISYDRNAGPVNYMKFLMGSLEDVKNRTKAIEAFATLLIPNFKLEKMFINVGEGANGKSTYLETIENFIGGSNVSNVSIHELAKDKNLKAELDGMLANIHTDISRKEIPELGSVKALISGDSITVHKKHQQPFKLKNKAKLFFSCNQLPELGEDGHATFRRLYLIEWNKIFTDDGPNQTNLNLLKELTTEQELSGILNLLIKVAQRIKKNGKLSYDEKTPELRSKWGENANPIGGFLETRLEQDNVTKTPKIEIYGAYQHWCQRKGITPKSNKVFNERLSHYFEIEPTTERFGDTPKKAWKGIRILPDVTNVTSITA